MSAKTVPRFTRARRIVGPLRWHANHTELVGAIEQLAVITLAAYVLHQFGGATGDTAALILYAVVKKVTLKEIQHRKDDKK
jgi:cobalamin synthase